MRISVADLRAQYDRATTNWWWIRTAENDHRVPPFLLFALGSRETNLRNVIGDGGHGVGIWQRDNRAFPELVGHEQEYLTTPLKQARDAATLLMGHFDYFTTNYPDRPLTSAVAAYNAGRGGVRKKLEEGAPADSATTGGDYAADVIHRWSYLISWGYTRI